MTIDDLRPNPDNPRRPPDAVDRVVVDGHARLDAARSAGEGRPLKMDDRQINPAPRLTRGARADHVVVDELGRVNPPALDAGFAGATGLYTGATTASVDERDAVIARVRQALNLGALSTIRNLGAVDAGAADFFRCLDAARAEVARVDALYNRPYDPQRAQALINDAVERAQTTPYSVGDCVAAAVSQYVYRLTAPDLTDWGNAFADWVGRALTPAIVDGLTALARSWAAWVNAGRPTRVAPGRPRRRGRGAVPYLQVYNRRYSLTRRGSQR